MTNSPFDDLERPVWERGFARDPRFVAALRIDPLLVRLGKYRAETARLGLRGERGFFRPDLRRSAPLPRANGRRRIDAQYCMVSLTPDFAFPAHTPAAQLIQHAIMPHGREHGQAFALMIGVKRNVNPRLRLAGDSVGQRGHRRGGKSLRGISRKQIPLHDARARKPARALRHGAQVPQPARLRLLVVSEQPVDHRGDDADAAGAARPERDAAAQRLPGARPARLQMEPLAARSSGRCSAKNTTTSPRPAGSRRARRSSAMCTTSSAALWSVSWLVDLPPTRCEAMHLLREFT